VLVALHGGAGEDGALREVLDLAGVPHVGSPAAACRIAWDKPTAKALLLRAGLATPPSVVLPHAAFRELGAAQVLDRLVAHLGLPLMVKPARGGSALGCSPVTEAEELPAAMVSCFSYGEAALVEQLVSGTEVAVTVIDTGDGPRALPAVEVEPLSGVYDYTARYTAGHTEFFAPARLGEPAACCGGRGCRGRPHGPRPARRLAGGRGRRRPGSGAAPGGQHLSRHDGDVAAADGRRGRRPVVRAGAPEPAGAGPPPAADGLAPVPAGQGSAGPR
jgi:hypothetical protein